jgi:hypothetical protein
MKYVLFWNMQRRVVIPYRRFGTAYRPNFQGSRSHWNNLPCVISQKRAYIVIRKTSGCRKVHTSNRTNTGHGVGFFEPDNGLSFQEEADNVLPRCAKIHSQGRNWFQEVKPLYSNYKQKNLFKMGSESLLMLSCTSHLTSKRISNYYIGMRRITTFRSTTDRTYDCDPIIL